MWHSQSSGSSEHCTTPRAGRHIEHGKTLQYILIKLNCQWSLWCSGDMSSKHAASPLSGVPPFVLYGRCLLQRSDFQQEACHCNCLSAVSGLAKHPPLSIALLSPEIIWYGLCEGLTLSVQTSSLIFNVRRSAGDGGVSVLSNNK